MRVFHRALVRRKESLTMEMQNRYPQPHDCVQPAHGRRARLAAVALPVLLLLGGCGARTGDAQPVLAQQAQPTLAPATPIPVRTSAAAPVGGTPDSGRIALARAAGYTGNVVAEEKIDIAAEVPGKVLALNVDVGAVVRTGDVLLEQDHAVLEARRMQAQAALETAAAQLELLLLPANESTLAAAQAAVSAAAARYQTAVDGPTDEDLRTAEAQLRQAQAAVTMAQAAYNLVKDRNDVGALPQSMQLEQATLQVEAAQAQYDKLVKGATEDQIAAAYAQVSQAQDQQSRLLEGAKEPQIRVAQAQVLQAETALYLAQVEMDKATVKAPIDGVVAAVYTSRGAQAAPGARLFTIQSLPVKVEVPVEETRLAHLRVGQPAEIRVNAYPDQVFAGEIAIIAPALDPATRTVQVTIRPIGDATLLRPGMFADVTLMAP